MDFGDCASKQYGLHDCNSAGSCITPSAYFTTQTRGVYTGQQPILTEYPILSSAISSHDVLIDNSQVYVLMGSARCVCSTGKFGTSCDSPCPTNIYNVSGTTCSNQGTCDATKHACTCQNGYGGDACEVECPDACTGKGTCGVDPNDEVLGVQCNCLYGWGGPSCNDLCSYGPNGQPCSGFGACDISKTCQCDAQHRGPTCEGTCPGSYRTSNGTLEVCNGRGYCRPDNPVAISNPVVYCECFDKTDSTIDCSGFLTSASGKSLQFVHYDLPPAPNLPNFVFPIIHVVYGVFSYSESTNTGGVNSATDVGADGVRSTSQATALAAGTPTLYLLFDITKAAVQQHLANVCDVIFASGLIREIVSVCLITAFQAWNYKLTNVGVDWELPGRQYENDPSLGRVFRKSAGQQSNMETACRFLRQRSTVRVH